VFCSIPGSRWAPFTTTLRPLCCIKYPSPCPLGGFFVGVLENIAGAYVVGTELKLTVALVIIVGVLVFKPAGLFGRTLVARV
jgi:branched-chain amino acid transport system permease protein